MAGRSKTALVLSVEERRVLARWARLRDQRALRARAVLLAADGKDPKAIADQTGMTEQTARKWRRRFVTDRLRGLEDQPRTGAPPKIGLGDVERAVVMTLADKAPDGHWTTRSLASALGLSQSAVSRIWRAFGLQPGRTAEPPFGDDVRDVLGVFVGPSELAAVVVTGRAGTAGASRAVSLVGQLRRRGGLATVTPDGGEATELGAFLASVAPYEPSDHAIYLVASRCDGRNARTLWRWLESDPRHHLHFVPSDTSQDLIDRWFARLTGAPLGRSADADTLPVPSFARYVALQKPPPLWAQRNQKPPASE